jgi:hypothetical protein
MNMFEVHIEPMEDNPVDEERGLGRNTGLYRLEIWERDPITLEFRFKQHADRDLTYDEAKIRQAQRLNGLNQRPQ